MTRLLPALLAAALSTAAFAQDTTGLSSPYPLTFPREGDGPLSSLLRLRDAEADYEAAGDRDDLWSRYTQVRAWTESFVGEHAAALRFFDATGSMRYDSTGTLPGGVRPVHAARYIAEAADDARVVMVNEVHHDASSRLLTLELLPLLYEKGFRYLAAEAFESTDTALSERGYPVDSSGLYTREPVFAALVREAARLGYTLVPYEIEAHDVVEDDTLSYQQRRDYAQAANLAARTVEIDPEARVLVHAGYAHVHEAATDYWHPMALYFRERTGIDPLTVDQTRLGEMSAPAYEHPAYRAADAAGLLGDRPAVLLTEAGTPLAPSDAPVDLQVFRPRAGVALGRPVWLAHLPDRTPISLDLAVCTAPVCEVTVTRLGEDEAAVPYDRVVLSRGETATVYVPNPGATAWVRDGRTGEVLHEIPVIIDEVRAIPLTEAPDR